MITFKRVKYSNFLSCGNIPIEIELNKHSNVLLIGKNGSGKSSSVTDTLTFALFGKPFRDINKPTLVNSENERDCLVELDFDVNGKSYLIRRGIKPNIFEIYRDGVLITKDAAVDDYQDYLEKHILKMNYKSFTQIVILGSASFTPFMQLKAADRRSIIEDLLDIQIFSVMNILAKQKLQSLRDETTTNDTEKNHATSSLDHVESTIKSMEEGLTTRVDDLKEKIEANNDQISGLNKIIDECLTKQKELDDYRASITALKKKQTTLVKLKTQIETTLNAYNKELTFFESNDSCPTCQQDIDKLFKSAKVKTNRGKLIEGKEGIDELSSTIKGVEENIGSLEKEIHNLSVTISEISSHKSKITFLQKENKLLTERITEIENADRLLSTHRDKKDELLRKLDELETKRETILTDREYYEQLVYLLKDGGIKTRIIKKYIPVINASINKYLNSMNLYVNFNLDENFKEIIKARYRNEYTYANFSEGEKFRIDISILFAWRQIAKMRNSVNCNLLIMDEIFDRSLDTEGMDDLMKIMLNDITKDTNLFVISHKSDQLRDKFEKTIVFEKVRGFTRIRSE